MIEDYKGIKISDNIIIVENVVTQQGYVVEPGNKKMLDSALEWGKSSDLIKDENGKLTVDENGNFVQKRFDAVVHEYVNGTFKLKLFASAKTSSQGGKLSFWNCTIVAPDGKEYIIGINSELLLKLMKETTIVCGDVTEPVWLGRQGGNVGVYTANMEDFKQAQRDNETRAKMSKGTSKYNIGDVVSTLTGEEIFIGQTYKYFDSGLDSNRFLNYNVNVFEKPRLVNVFADKKCADKWNKEGKTESKHVPYHTTYTKPKRVPTGEKVDYTDELMKHWKAQESVWGSFYGSYKEFNAKEFSLMYSDDSTKNVDDIVSSLIESWKDVFRRYHSGYDYTLCINTGDTAVSAKSEPGIYVNEND